MNSINSNENAYEKRYQSGYGVIYPEGYVIRLYESILKYESAEGFDIQVPIHGSRSLAVLTLSRNDAARLIQSSGTLSPSASLSLSPARISAIE